ncbi:Glycerophosphocholine phosphodiesterase [Phlyctochytrium bullatum]|nr:Glycerophosphocholine phosphodiesterase [Phlyctochytrium bullatum]
MDQLDTAFELAGLMRSLDLLNDLRNTFPDITTDDVDSDLMRKFLFASAQSGFCDGLDLIPPEHPILLWEHDSDYRGMTLLDLATASRRTSAVALLLAKGAPVNRPWPVPHRTSVKPPLFSALENKDLHLIRLLLQYGTDLASHYEGYLPLHRAAMQDHPESLKLLLEFGADIDVCSWDGLTPLGNAARAGQSECVRVLVDAGANVDAGDRHQKTALVWACQFGCLDTVEFLIARGASVNPAPSPVSPLYVAVSGRHNLFDVVKTLVEAGAEVNWLDSKGQTALHHAMLHRRSRTALLLLDAGADPTIKCHAGITPLQLFPSRVSWNTEWEAVLDRLIEKGADLQEKDPSGMTTWQKLREAAMRSPGLLQWVLRRWGFDQTVNENFTMVWEELFAEFMRNKR